MTVRELIAKCRINEQRAQELRLRLPTSLTRNHSQGDRHMLVWLPSKIELCIEACQDVRRDYERQLAALQVTEDDTVYATAALANIELDWETIENWFKSIGHAA